MKFTCEDCQRLYDEQYTQEEPEYDFVAYVERAHENCKHWTHCYSRDDECGCGPCTHCRM